MTSKFNLELYLQKAGHGELVETQNGEWILAHLASRPIGKNRDCILGRETCLQKVVWNEEGWLRLEKGGNEPSENVEVNLPEYEFEKTAERDDFDGEILNKSWNSLRIKIDESWANLTERRGFLRLHGRESLKSLHNQSLLGKRLQFQKCTVETKLEFSPENFNQFAGLIIFYNTEMNFYLRVSHEETRGKFLGIVLNDDGVYDELLETNIEINSWKQIYLRADVNFVDLQFWASFNGENWQTIGGVLNLGKLSEDYGKFFHFTGTFVGICCPGHGAGSACGKSIGDRRQTTIGNERVFSETFKKRTEKEFVEWIFEGMPEPPAHYPKLKKINAKGAKVFGHLPLLPPLKPKEFQTALEDKDAVVIDARSILAFAGGHLPGAINIALRDEFPTWVGWMIDPSKKIYVVVESVRDVKPVSEHLFRIGYDNIQGYLQQGMAAWENAALPLETLNIWTAPELNEHKNDKDLQILDVRSPGEWEKGHVPNARNKYVAHLEENLGGLDKSKPVAVYCGSGYRASIAASILKRNGFEQVINIPG